MLDAVAPPGSLVNPSSPSIAATAPRHVADASAQDRAAPRLVSVATALPAHRISQREARALSADLFAGAFGAAAGRLLEIFDHTGVEHRHICMPLEWYARPRSFGDANDLYLAHGLALSTTVAERALAGAGLAPRDVDHVVFVSSTGLSTPSMDARLANRLGLRADVRRTPLWGLGCAGGAAGLSHARDFAAARPGARVLLVALELCSLTFQHGDLDRRNLVAASRVSDGAAAAVVAGHEVTGAADAPGAIEVLASRSTLWPDTLDVMGWTIDETGLHVVFSRDIPTLVRERVRDDLVGFLASHGLGLDDVTEVIAHPGGPKVLAALAEALGRPETAFYHAREVLRTCGNMSSPTCLFVLERVLAEGGPAAGALGVIAALGPGFSAEYLLVRGASPGRSRPA